uniref:Secreted protein n=1 Tax=Anguilla anguilla TaxID=7936 RepID=A0A0E9R7Y9_ANGAN
MLNVTASWVHFLLQGSVPWACARLKIFQTLATRLWQQMHPTVMLGSCLKWEKSNTDVNFYSTHWPQQKAIISLAMRAFVLHNTE